ncbi:MbtH family protein [Streptomyces sp. NPDC021020]|uniref:MbtH family protein n=1 Tax=Streptomyces sp. NPDC021020 TaxID=3365109 RepID=UPI00378A5369
MVEDGDANRVHIVVRNDEGQYSVVAADRELPEGWHAEGTRGRKEDCLAHVDRVWTDMRPASLRAHMGG